MSNTFITKIHYTIYALVVEEHGSHIPKAVIKPRATHKIIFALHSNLERPTWNVFLRQKVLTWVLVGPVQGLWRKLLLREFNLTLEDIAGAEVEVEYAYPSVLNALRANLHPGTSEPKCMESLRNASDVREAEIVQLFNKVA